MRCAIMKNVMLSKKDFKVVLFAILCIHLNIAGRLLSDTLNLPLWLDSIGTVIASYQLGWACGSLVGITMNIIYSLNDPVCYLYSVTSIAISVVVGITAKKKWFENLFQTMSASVLVTIISVIVSTPLNWIFAQGMTGNTWGDGVIKYLEEQGLPILLSAIAGQFYIDFLDKVVTLMLLYLMIKLWRNRKNLFRKKRSFIFISILIPLSFSRISTAQAAPQNFETYVQTIYSNASGLPCGEANDVAQTNDGILWIGTYAGLYRYNGSEFKWMNEYESVRSVNCLYVDEEGRLWIGTNDNGLSICINEKIMNTLDSSDGLPSNSVRSIVKSSDGYYYVGTSLGIFVLELNGGLRISNIIQDVGYIVDLCADKNGFVAAVSANGELFILNESTVCYSKTLGAGKEIITCCTFDKNGILYIGTSKNHINRYEIDERDTHLLDTRACDRLSSLNTIFFDNEKTFICADNGIGFFDKSNNFHTINTGSFNNSIDNMTVDYQGNYWFTSSRKGLLRLSASSFTNIYGSLGLSEQVVNTVTEWNGVLYVGTDRGLDAIQNNRKIENNLTTNFANDRIRCIYKDSKDTLWICTYGRGLIHVEKNGRMTSYDSSNSSLGNRLRVCIELHDGTIVCSSEKGVSYIANGKVIKTLGPNDGLTNAMILSLMEMKDGTILAGSNGNGLAIIRNGKIENILSVKNGLTSDVILRTVREENGNGAFIVTSNSICYLNEKLLIKPLNNFPYFNNYDIASNGDTMFILGSAGIYVVNKNELLKNNGSLQYELLDSKSGLDSALTANAWNYCDENKNLYLSCGNGVYKVDMNNYLSGKRTYHLMVSKIKLDGVSFQLNRSEPFIISRDIAKIEFAPEVINYTVLDPFVSYQLEGFDTAATVIPQSELTNVVYTNLPSGSYKFNLAVLDKNRNILERSSYELIKEKAIYDTRYFKVYLVLVSGLAIAYFTWLIARIKIQRAFELQRQQLAFAKEQVRLGNETILAIAKTVDAKDENTSQHSVRVSEYSVMIARELGFTNKECENLRKAALLHDIGKIGIPDRILNKPAKLDDNEYAIMKSHVTRGAEILKDFTMIDHVHEGTLYHHEKYDGTGYPYGLAGEAIPIYGRIIGAADAFDAMTANRVYRKQLDFNYVLSELKRCRGTQFDPKIIDIILKLIETGKIDINSLYKNTK